MAEELVSQLHSSLTTRPQRELKTGFRWLDGVTHGGLRTGDVSVVTAFSGFGKTAFVEQLALHVSQQHGVLLLPLEMGEAKTMVRLGAKLSRCSVADYVRSTGGKVDPITAHELRGRHLRVREPKPRRRVNVAAIAKVIDAEQLDGARRPLVIVDHVRELDGWLSDRGGHVGATVMCQQFADLAVELDVHIMLCAQLSTDCIGKRPEFWKPQDTIMLTQVASLWLKLHRPFSGRSNPEEDDVALIIAAKNRWGPANVSHPYRWVGVAQTMWEFSDEERAYVEERLSPRKKRSGAAS